MSVTLPCATIFVMLSGFGGIATCGANKNPTLTFFYLYAVERCILFAAGGAYFCFH